MKTLRKIYDDLGARLFGVMHSEEGQALVEYALLLILIALVVIAMLQGTGKSVNQAFSKINSGLNTV